MTEKNAEYGHTDLSNNIYDTNDGRYIVAKSNVNVMKIDGFPRIREDGVPELTVGAADGDSVGFCSIPYHSTQEECEEAGGTWTQVDVDTDFSKVDTSALTNELAKQIQELDRCFADPDLERYLEEL